MRGFWEGPALLSHGVVWNQEQPTGSECSLQMGHQSVVRQGRWMWQQWKVVRLICEWSLYVILYNYNNYNIAIITALACSHTHTHHTHTCTHTHTHTHTLTMWTRWTVAVFITATVLIAVKPLLFPGLQMWLQVMCVWLSGMICLLSLYLLQKPCSVVSVSVCTVEEVRRLVPWRCWVRCDLWASWGEGPSQEGVRRLWSPNHSAGTGERWFAYLMACFAYLMASLVLYMASSWCHVQY